MVEATVPKAEANPMARPLICAGNNSVEYINNIAK